MAAAMQAAQARAIRPGDDALGCPALEKELVASMNDPAIQTYAGKSAAAAQKNAAAEKSKAPMTPQAAAALAAAFGAGGGLPPGLAAGYAAQSQAAQKLQAEQMKQMIPIMPQMMRSQRIIQLAAVKQCAWMFGGVPFAPPVPAR